MKLVLQLLAVGEVDGRLLDRLGASLEEKFRVTCQVSPAVLDPAFAFHVERQQYHSTEVLMRMRSLLTPRTWRVLGVTAHDLYIPILTFVFGEAELGGDCALISLHRLRQEFYGLPRDDQLMRERLMKEAMHELGHTLDLTHCHDYSCAMAPSHAVEWIDLKTDTLCQVCYGKVLANSR